MGSSKAIILLLLSSLVCNTIVGHNNKELLHVVNDLANRTAVQTNKHWYDNFCFSFLTFHCPQQNLTPLPFPSPVMSPVPPLPPSMNPQVLSPPSPSPQQELPKSELTTPPRPTAKPCHCQLEFQDQRLAAVYPIILKFKNTITSDPLGITTTWVGSDICSYKGFYCDHPPDNASATAVASIDFNNYQLSAPTLDGFIDQLPDIALFHANSNNFGGTISLNIAKLQYLYELDISNNQFSGPFPTAVLGMEDLTFLDLRFNAFSGSVPPAIYTQNLNVLFLNDNDFISSLPYDLNTSQILYLTLANNKFTGPIPRDISIALSGLTEVLLLNNQLTGCLPYELGFLKQVTVLDISNNLLTGPLPFSLSCLERVEVLNLDGNLLYGAVPDLMCGLPNLANLSLSGNYFTHLGPLCENLISRGVLDVQNNCIHGQPSQRSVVDCAKFYALPRICPHMGTYKIIPCKPSHFP